MKKINPNQLKNNSVNPSQRSGPRKLVLYVEDDQDNREVASARLDKRYELILATNDREACEAICTHASSLSLILMDIELKGSHLNGIDLTCLIRGKLDSWRIPSFAKGVPELDVPILFVTAYGRNYNTDELIRAGGDDVIQKPVNFVELHTAMARAYLKRIG